jgi:8-oxo-dGTP diphosphatase
MKTEYVCGFLFSPDGKKVVLIKKNRPENQAGKLNGIGGKIEPGETPEQAMIREFNEEAGIYIDEWIELWQEIKPMYRVHYFFSINDHLNVKQGTDEPVCPVLTYMIDQLECVDHVKHLIHKAIELIINN